MIKANFNQGVFLIELEGTHVSINSDAYDPVTYQFLKPWLQWLEHKAEDFLNREYFPDRQLALERFLEMEGYTILESRTDKEPFEEPQGDFEY